MEIFSTVLICSILLAGSWFAFGKSVHLPMPHVAWRKLSIPAPRFTSPSRKAVFGISAIHLIYLAVVIGGCLLLRQLFALLDWMTAAGITPAQVGPFLAGVIYTIAAVAGGLLLLSLCLTVRKSAAWFTLACHSALVLCVCRQIVVWLSMMSEPSYLQTAMTQYLLVYLVVILVCTGIFFLYIRRQRTPLQLA